MVSRLTIRGLLFAAATALAACGGDDDGVAVDAPRIDASPTDAADIDAEDIDAPDIDAPDIDAPDIDAPDIDAPDIDAPDIDAPDIDAPVDAGTDGTPIDAPIDAPPPIDAPIDAPPPIDAPIDSPPALAGDLCSSAEPITLTAGSASITSTTAAYTNNYQPGVCAGVNSNGPDRVHSITIPPNQRLTASVDPTSSTYDPGIFLIGGPAAQCDQMPITCLTSNDGGGDGVTDTIVYNNVSGNPLEVFIIIDGFRLAGDAYTLNVTVGDIPPAPQGDVCSTAQTITLTNGMATVNGTTVDYNNDYDPGVSCTSYFTDGPDAIHQVSVDNGATLTVTMTPAASYDAGVYLIAGPAAQCDAEPLVCLDGADLEFAGDPEIVTYTNMSGGAQTVFIGVDGDIELSSGDTYSLQVTVTLP